MADVPYCYQRRSVTAITLRRQWHRRSGPRPRYLGGDDRIAPPSSRARPAPTALNTSEHGCDEPSRSSWL